MDGWVDPIYLWAKPYASLIEHKPENKGEVMVGVCLSSGKLRISGPMPSKIMRERKGINSGWGIIWGRKKKQGSRAAGKGKGQHTRKGSRKASKKRKERDKTRTMPDQLLNMLTKVLVPKLTLGSVLQNMAMHTTYIHSIMNHLLIPLVQCQGN